MPEDSHGLPLGQVKHKWAVKNLSLFCCALDIVNDRHDIKVQKGETYWIVAETDATNRDTGDQWEYTWNHTVSNEIATRAHPFMWVRYHHWSPRGGVAIAYDPVGRKVVLFGGFNSTEYLNETWTFNGSTWTIETTSVAPWPRASAMLAYDVSTRKLALFGGFNNPEFLGDTWFWDGATSTWTRAHPTHSPGPF